MSALDSVPPGLPAIPQQEVVDRADLASSLQWLHQLITGAQEMGKKFTDGRQ